MAPKLKEVMSPSGIAKTPANVGVASNSLADPMTGSVDPQGSKAGRGALSPLPARLVVPTVRLTSAKAKQQAAVAAAAAAEPSVEEETEPSFTEASAESSPETAAVAADKESGPGGG